MARKNASVSAEDYLERIHELIEEKGYARAVDIARALGISQPSVTAMVKKLAEEGLLHYERYRGLTLTDEGRRVARAIRQRHEILRRFLSLLGVSPAAQERDIEGLEHHISDETIRALARLTEDLERAPSHSPVAARDDPGTSRATRRGPVREARKTHPARKGLSRKRRPTAG